MASRRVRRQKKRSDEEKGADEEEAREEEVEEGGSRQENIKRGCKGARGNREKGSNTEDTVEEEQVQEGDKKEAGQAEETKKGEEHMREQNKARKARNTASSFACAVRFHPRCSSDVLLLCVLCSNVGWVGDFVALQVSSALVCNACRFPDALPDHMSRFEHAISNFAPRLCVLGCDS